MSLHAFASLIASWCLLMGMLKKSHIEGSLWLASSGCIDFIMHIVHAYRSSGACRSYPERHFQITDRSNDALWATMLDWASIAESEESHSSAKDGAPLTSMGAIP